MKYIWKNKETDECVEVQCRLADIDKFLEEVDDPENWTRVPQLPNVRTEKLSKTWPEGYVPASRKADLSDVKQAEKMKIESYGMKPTERTEIKKEIKKIKKLKR